MNKFKTIAWAMTAAVMAAFLLWGGITVLRFFTIALPLAVFIRALYRSSNIESDVTASFAKLYAFEVFFPFVWVAVLSICGIMPLSTIISFIALPIAIACAQTVKNSVEGGKKMLADLYPRTANLHFVYTALLTLAFIAAIVF